MATLIPGIEVKNIFIYDTHSQDDIDKIFTTVKKLIKQHNKYYYDVAMIKNKNIIQSANVIKMVKEQNVVYVLVGDESKLSMVDIDHIVYLSDGKLIIYHHNKIDDSLASQSQPFLYYLSIS